MQFTINRTYRNNLKLKLADVHDMARWHTKIAVPPAAGQQCQCAVDEDDNLPCKGGDNKPGNHADTCKREEWQA